MLRKALLSTLIALFGLLGILLGNATDVVAQTTAEETPEVSVLPVVDVATVVQSVPVTLTLTIAGPTGPMTVEVPIFLSLDIRIGISPELTTTLAVTPSVVTVVTPEASEPVTSTAATATPIPTPTLQQLTASPTATATPSTPSEEAPSEAATAAPTEVPLPTATATPEPEPVIVAPSCPDARSLIIAPGVGQTVSGMVNILGTATHENFQYYKVEYASGTDVDPNSDFAYLGGERVQVTGSVLASFDSAEFDNGAYTLKLTVVDNLGNFPPPCTVSIVVAN